MRVGQIFEDRFELVERAGAGGMGTVWRVTDQQTGTSAALKVLRDPDAENANRFVHEGRLLASLDHPHIVQYVVHGFSESGEPYLVMEWLEGESLAERLERGALDVDETLALVQRVAGALGAAHQRGVIHRDIKPSNLFLVGGDVRQVKVLDFGIARQSGATGGMTRTGSILGTPGYMAPEQARGDRDIRPTADVFALGCVMFECLTGQPAFQGAHPVALLAKLLFEDAPRLHELRPDLPRSVSMIASRMMAKEPTARPAHGAAVESALNALMASPLLDATRDSMLPPAITNTERRFVFIIAVALPEATGALSEATTISAGAPQDLMSAVRRAVVPLGASVEVLANGTVIAMLVGEGNASDQAATAARCALWVKSTAKEAAVVLVTGRADSGQSLPIGEVLERAAALLDKTAGVTAPVRIDGATQALLDSRFLVIEDHGRIGLRDERRIGEEPRMLLGRSSPFVGRDRELRNILALVEDAFEERRSVAILVTGAPGMGKSRLRQELSRAIREHRADVGFVLASADGIGAGSAFGLITDSLRNTLQLTAGEPIEAQREKIKHLVEIYFRGDDAQRISEFMGELAMTPFPDDVSPRLRAARQNPQLMADQVLSAYIDLVQAVATPRDLFFVLEDLHWGDAPSIKLLDVVLRDLHDCPIAIVAFARPEVHDVFPRLWLGRNVHEVRLGPLPRRAALELVQTMLGTTTAPERASALVERAEGNAFYLEELIRSVAEGRDEVLPETVLGMVEARLSRLSSNARRLLRAASVFGESFWKGGVKALVGPDEDVDAELASLAADEFITARVQSRFAGEEEYVFRHALVREGAYAMLAAPDCTLGHRLAGEWLERAGELDSMILAEHFERGDGRENASGYYLQAAEQALRGSDMQAAVERAERGIMCGASGERLGAMLSIQSEALMLFGQYQKCYEKSLAALAATNEGSVAHCRALSMAMVAVPQMNDPAAAPDLMQRLLRIEPAPEGLAWIMMSLVSVMYMILCTAGRELAAVYMQRMSELAAHDKGPNVLITAWQELARGIWSRHADQNPYQALVHDRAAEEAFSIAEDRNYKLAAVTYVGLDLVQLGRWEEAEKKLAIAVSDNHRVNMFSDMARYHRGFMRLLAGQIDDAIALAQAEIDRSADIQNKLLPPLNAIVLAIAHIRKGNHAIAEAILLPIGDPSNYPLALSVGLLTALSELRLAQGNAGEAARLADDAMAIGQNAGVSVNNHGLELPLIHVLALREAGRLEQYRTALDKARSRLLSQAEEIEESEHRERFLAVPARAQLLELAREIVA